MTQASARQPAQHTSQRATWIAQALSVPILDELERRSAKLKRYGTGKWGTNCPKCGPDRIIVDARANTFTCRCTPDPATTISLVQLLDGIDHDTACATLAGPCPDPASADQPKLKPKTKTNGNGKTNGHPPKQAAIECGCKTCIGPTGTNTPCLNQMHLPVIPAKPEEKPHEPVDTLAVAAPVGEISPAPAENAEPIIVHNADDPALNESEIKEEIERLASLSDLVYQTMREAAARRLNIRTSVLDRFVREARKTEETSDNTAAPLHPHWAVEPWPEPVDTDALVRDLVARIRKHLVCSREAALAAALWIVFAWCHDKVATHSPILNVSSPESESGKSSMLGLISFLVPRAISSVDISGASLFRSIELWQPSFVIDEFDTALSSDDAAALRSVINSGHTRGQGVIRCVEPEYQPRLFKTFCPKAIGMIGQRLPNTTLSRCIVVELLRRREDEDIEKFNHVDDEGLSDLRRQLLRWSTDNTDKLIAIKNTVAMPEGFGNRRADNWRVLFAIADLAGEEFGESARTAAAKIEGSADTTSIRVRALIDIRSFFYPKDSDGRELEPLDRISSSDLVAWLASMPEGPWAQWGKRGKPITQAELAFLIKGFGVAPEVIRFPSGGTSRGYLRTQFEDAWERYLPLSAR